MKKYATAMVFVFFFLLGVSGCRLSDKVSLDPLSEGLDDAIQLVMTGPEKKILNSLRDQALREEFIQEFWDKRDPDISTDENEFQQEFEERFSFVNLHFKSEGIPGWKTDRGRIYMYLGPPDQSWEQPYLNYANMKGRIVWVYYKYQTGVEFIDRTGTNKYEMQIDSHYSLRLLWAIDRAKFGLIRASDAALKEGDEDIDIAYDQDTEEIIVSIPATTVYFKEEGDDLLLDFRFDFYVYLEEGGRKDKFHETKSFRGSNDEVVEMDEIVFTFPYKLSPGSYFLDVKVSDTEGIGQFRKIVKVKVKS